MSCSFDPKKLKGKPIGMFHCPECEEMVIAGLEHPDYDLLKPEIPENDLSPIKTAAIKINNKIFTGKDHGIIIRNLVIKEHSIKNRIEGFITEDNIFLDRQQAFIRAIQCNQLIESYKKEPKLNSYMLKT